MCVGCIISDSQVIGTNKNPVEERDRNNIGPRQPSQPSDTSFYRRAAVTDLVLLVDPVEFGLLEGLPAGADVVGQRLQLLANQLRVGPLLGGRAYLVGHVHQVAAVGARRPKTSDQRINTIAQC